MGLLKGRKFMGALNRSSLQVVLLAAVLAAAGPVRAELASSSPFLPSGTAAAGAGGGPAGPIELRGVMSTPEGSAFCIYDTAKKKNVWVGLNESGHDFVVKTADPASDSVTVSYQGRTMRLDLHTAKVSAAPVQAPPTGPVPGSVVVNPSPADEQRRLDAVAQEVRRRRAERERSTQDPGGQPAPGPPPGGR
jgi:hypothetical protein